MVDHLLVWVLLSGSVAAVKLTTDMSKDVKCKDFAEVKKGIDYAEGRIIALSNKNSVLEQENHRLRKEKDLLLAAKKMTMPVPPDQHLVQKDSCQHNTLTKSNATETSDIKSVGHKCPKSSGTDDKNLNKKENNKAGKQLLSLIVKTETPGHNSTTKEKEVSKSPRTGGHAEKTVFSQSPSASVHTPPRIVVVEASSTKKRNNKKKKKKKGNQATPFENPQEDPVLEYRDGRIPGMSIDIPVAVKNKSFADVVSHENPSHENPIVGQSHTTEDDLKDIRTRSDQSTPAATGSSDVQDDVSVVCQQNVQEQDLKEHNTNDSKISVNETKKKKKSKKKKKKQDTSNVAAGDDDLDVLQQEILKAKQEEIATLKSSFDQTFNEMMIKVEGTAEFQKFFSRFVHCRLDGKPDPIDEISKSPLREQLAAALVIEGELFCGVTQVRGQYVDDANNYIAIGYDKHDCLVLQTAGRQQEPVQINCRLVKLNMHLEFKDPNGKSWISPQPPNAFYVGQIPPQSMEWTSEDFPGTVMEFRALEGTRLVGTMTVDGQVQKVLKPAAVEIPTHYAYIGFAYLHRLLNPSSRSGNEEDNVFLLNNDPQVVILCYDILKTIFEHHPDLPPLEIFYEKLWWEPLLTKLKLYCARKTSGQKFFNKFMKFYHSEGTLDMNSIFSVAEREVIPILQEMIMSRESPESSGSKKQ